MIQYPCPICSKRACDSNKILHLAKLSAQNEEQADIIIKCRNCKNAVAVIVSGEEITLKKYSIHG